MIDQEVAKEIRLVLSNVNPLSSTPVPGSSILVAQIKLGDA
jgi:hypothetical protein